ncbi:MAG: hypothetical protein OJF55_002633 [Rhodanobacteraceae bacterium]|jgi:hypothetical protein|nr:MAG: hypothetical protein OJF55_002633 [Rhodanobacteraceae bacterium]
MTSKIKIDGRTYGSMEAEALAAALCITKTALRPKAANEDKRLAGARKKRRADINEWIEKQLKRDPSASARGLYARAPNFITDYITTLTPFRARVTVVREQLGLKRKRCPSNN